MAMADEMKTLREKVAEHELMARTAVAVVGGEDMLEHRSAGGELLGYVGRGGGYSAYGPGSITDAASYCRYEDCKEPHEPGEKCAICPMRTHVPKVTLRE